MVCSDSKSALQSIQQSEGLRPIGQAIRKLLHKIDHNNQKVLFMWTPGHVGISGNEMADRRAKQALGLEYITETPTDYRDSLPRLKRQINICFARFWQQSRHTFLKHIKPDVGEWTTAYRTSRREEVAIARLRNGHTRLTHNVLLHSDQRHSICPTCNAPLTVFHVLMECRLYLNERRVLKGHCTMHSIPFNLPHLLGNSSSSTIEAVCKFLKDTHLIDEI